VSIYVSSQTLVIEVDMSTFTVLNISKLKNQPQPNRNQTATVLKCFAIFKNVVHGLKPDETPRYSASDKAPNYVQRFKISQNMVK